MQRLVLLCGLILGCGSFSFGAAGDYACGQNYLDTLSAVNASGINVMVALGDLGYETGREQWWCEQWGNRTKVNELLIIGGNHDVGEDCCGDWQTYLNNCPVAAPRNGTPGVRYYIDYPLNAPLVRFIGITPGLGGSVASYSTYGTGGAGLLWLNATIDDARAQGIPWIVVGMHKNYISVLTKGDEIGAPLMDLLFAKRVDVILQAHEHGYERTKQLTCAVVNSFNASCVAASVPSVKGLGSVIVVLGTGGQTLRTIAYGDPEWNYFASVDSTTYGFGLFEVTAERLRYNFTRSAGNITFQDSFELNVNTSAPTSATPTTSGAPSSSAPSLIPSTSAPSLAPTQTPTQTPTGTPSTNTPTTTTPTFSTPTAESTTPTTDTPTPITVLNAATTATGGLELAALGAALVTLALLR